MQTKMRRLQNYVKDGGKRRRVREKERENVMKRREEEQVVPGQG